MELQSGTKVVDTLVSNGCFYQTFNSLIISFLLNAINPLNPKSMLSEIKERIEGPKYNIDFGGRGWGKQGKGIGMSTTQKGAILRSVSTLLSLIVAAQE